MADDASFSDPASPPADDVLGAQTADAIDKAARTAQDIAGDIASVAGGPEIPAGDIADVPSVLGDAGDARGEEAFPEEEVPPAPVQVPLSRELRRLLAIEVPVIVQLGTRRMTVAEVTRFAVGAIIEFNKAADEELELLANNESIGKGQAVKVGENFGIKISSIGSVRETIQKLGAA
jgi:flagellar motor switch protein FliN/FliY